MSTPSDAERSRNGYVPSDNDPPPRGLMRRLFALCNALGLDRAERLELAEMLLQRDVTSYKNLVHYDVVRLVDAIVGFGLVSILKDVREPCRRCGQRESATGPGGECATCRRAWERWTPPPAVEAVIDAALEAAEPGNERTAILEALHREGYRIDIH